MEKEGAKKAYKAVFDYKKINEGFCVYILVNVSTDEYGKPERIAGELAKYREIESVDILAGNWELTLRVRAKDQDDYYKLLKSVLSRPGIEKSTSLTSLKQVKTKFVSL